MGRLGVIGAGLVCACAFGQTATFTPLVGDRWPFPVVGSNWRSAPSLPPLSGDGSTVTDGRWRWTRSGGIVPAGFIPGFNQSIETVRSPFDLSYDGTIEFGRLRDVRTATLWNYYWEGGGRFELLPNASAIVPTWAAFISRSCLSEDGLWIVLADQAGVQPRVQYRRSRSGQVEAYPAQFAQGLYFIWSPSANAASVLTVEGVLRIGASQSAADAVLLPKPVFDSYLTWPIAISSDGHRVLMYLSDPGGYPIGVVWNTELGETDAFSPPHGFRSFLPSDEWGIDEFGELAVGLASNQPQSIASSRVFVRRKGEQARELRVVLDRFGDTSSNYYVIERVGGMSRDGKTILVLYSSPWYGDGAAIVTLPDWEPCPADINFDGVVDDGDFVLFVDAYLRLTTTDGDLTLDRMTDNADFVIFATAYNEFLCP